MAGQPFPVDPVLTGIAIAFVNGELIADKVMPRLGPPLTKETFKWKEYDFNEGITLTDTRVGRKGRPNTVEFGYTEKPGATVDFGLSSEIPNADIKNAEGTGFSPQGHATERLTDKVLLDREVRVANLTFSPANYPTGNKETLSGSAQWNDPNSTPIEDISDACDAMVMRPNQMVLGRKTWTTLRRHPKIVKAVSASGTESGQITLQAFKDLIEIEDIEIGATWLNTAKPGQAPNRTRVWGNHCALLRQEKLASSQGDVATWGWTAQFGTRVSGERDDPHIGLRGGVEVRVGESVAEIIAAAALGYLFNNAVAN